MNQSRCVRKRTRCGMTLLEVVIALAMFFAAMSAIGQILRMGSDSAIRAQIRAEGTLLGESKLNEVIAGVVPLQAATAQPFENAPQWSWSLTVEDDTDVAIKRLLLTVTHQRASGEADHQIKFARMLRDPAIFQQTGNTDSTLDTLNNVLQ
jgi:general secretion pathway protein I